MANQKQSRWDARALFDAGPRNWSKDTSLIPVFAGRSIDHLRMVLREFETLADMQVDGVLHNESHNDTNHLLEQLSK